MNRRHLIRRLVLTIGLACPFVTPPALEGQSRDPLAGLDVWIEKVRAEWSLPGMAVGIVKGDSLIYAKGFGVRELGKPDPVDAATIFAIGSNTKSFTSLAAAILVDEGRLGWDDRAVDRYPGFELFDPYVTREITVRDLMSHRSGLGRRGDALWYGTDFSRDEIIRRIRYLEPNAGFRTEMGYQNIMFLTAGEIIGKASGLGWDRFVTERILSPLGMVRSTTSVKPLKSQANVSTPHAMDAGVATPIPWRDIDNVAPAGSINSSVVEMGNYLRLHLAEGTFRGRRVVSKANLAVTKTPHINTGGAGDSVTHFNAYGLGWGLRDYHGVKIASHTGGIDGMLSQMWTVPEAGLGVVVLTNASPQNAGAVVAAEIVDRFLGVPSRDRAGEAMAQWKRVTATQADAARKRDSMRLRGTSPSLPLDKYAGGYASRMYGDVTISVEGGRLVAAWQSYRVPLEHWHLNTFRGTAVQGAPLAGSMLTFQINAMARPASVDIGGLATFAAKAR